MIYLVEKCKPDFRARNQLRPVAWGKGSCLETRWGAVGITKQNRTHGSGRHMCQLEVLLMALTRDIQGGLGNAWPKDWTVCVYVCIVCICVYVVGTCDMWHLHMYVDMCVLGHMHDGRYGTKMGRSDQFLLKSRGWLWMNYLYAMVAVWETSELEVQSETASSWISEFFGDLGSICPCLSI